MAANAARVAWIDRTSVLGFSRFFLMVSHWFVCFLWVSWPCHRAANQLKKKANAAKVQLFLHLAAISCFGGGFQLALNAKTSSNMVQLQTAKLENHERLTKILYKRRNLEPLPTKKTTLHHSTPPISSFLCFTPTNHFSISIHRCKGRIARLQPHHWADASQPLGGLGPVPAAERRAPDHAAPSGAQGAEGAAGVLDGDDVLKLILKRSYGSNIVY